MRFSKRLVAIFIAVFSVHSLASAQYTLKGTVSDENNVQVDDAAVQIYLLADTSNRQGQNSTDGQFSFSGLEKGVYALEVSKIGYLRAAVYLQLEGDSTLSIQITTYTEELEDVTLVGKRKEIEQRPDRFIFNVSSSVMAQGGNALTALSKIPGVQISGSAIHLAGKGSVKLMINNKTLEISEDQLTNYLTTLANKDIDRIEVITSPDASYDAAGDAGIIQIITKTADQEGWSGSLLGNYGNQNGYYQYQFNGSVQYKKGRWNAFANVHLDRHKELMGWIIGVEYPTYDWSLNDTGIYRIDNYNAIAGIGYQLGKNSELQLSYHYGYREEGHGLDGHDDVKNYITDKAGNVDSVIRSYATYNPVAKTNAVDLHFKTQLSDEGATLSADADYFNFFRTDYSNFRGYAQPVLQDGGDQNALYRNTAKQNILIYTGKVDVSIPSKSGSWKFGAKVSNINIYSDALYYNLAGGNSVFDSSASNIYDYTENTRAGYLQWSNKWEALAISAGVRAEHTTTTGHSILYDRTDRTSYLKFYPSLQLNYDINAQNHLWLEFNRRINRPTFWNLNPYRSMLTAYAYYDGNPELQPEYTSQLELGHSFKQLLYSSLYYRHTQNSFTDLTIGSVDTFLVYRTPMNFLTMDVWGLQQRANFRRPDGGTPPYRRTSIIPKANQRWTSYPTNPDGGSTFPSAILFILIKAKASAALSITGASSHRWIISPPPIPTVHWIWDYSIIPPTSNGASGLARRISSRPVARLSLPRSTDCSRVTIIFS